MYVYLFGLFFLIYKTSSYFPSFSLLIFLLFIFSYSTITFCIIHVSKKIKTQQYIYGWIIIFWYPLLFKESFDNAISSILGFAIRIRYSPIIILAGCVCYFYVKKIIPKLLIPLINKTVNLFFVFMIIVNLIIGFDNFIKETNHSTLKAKKDGQPIKIEHKKDIIWILMDEYGAPSYLKNEFRFYNPLLDSLKKRRFFTFDSLASRSDYTIYSLSSLFNLDDSILPSNDMYASLYLRKSTMVEQLKNLGYSFTNLDFIDIYNQHKIAKLPFFSDTYFSQIINHTIFSKIILSLIRPLDNYNNQVIAELNNTVKNNYQKPNFTWAHLLIPHSPYLRNSDGELNKNPIFNTSPIYTQKNEIINQYLNYLLYGNTIILKILNQIPDWQNKIIIISGDHGARMFLKDGDPRRFATFAAIYYPGMDTMELKQIKYLQQIPFHLH